MSFFSCHRRIDQSLSTVVVNMLDFRFFGFGFVVLGRGLRFFVVDVVDVVVVVIVVVFVDVVE